MPRQKESNAELLLKLPWWISAIIGAIAFIAMRWVIPARIDHNQSFHPFAQALVKLSPAPIFIFGLFAVGSFVFAKKRSRLVDDQTSLEKLRETGWKDFEYLVAEAFRRQGYAVDYSLGRGADGGVDLTLCKDGRTSFVQCKQWKVFSIGVPVVREMFGLMTAEQADEAIIVTTGKFTRDAQDFATGKPIRLIDGPELLALVKSVQKSASLEPHDYCQVSNMGDQAPNQSSGGANDEPACPLCSRPMVQRVAKRGPNAGNHFWGCSSYPACKGTRS